MPLSDNSYFCTLIREYSLFRKNELVLINIDFDNLKFQEKTVTLLQYSKLNKLFEFIKERSFMGKDEITGHELRVNGYEELVNPIDVSKYIGNKYPNDLEFKESQSINSISLAAKIIIIEANTTLSTVSLDDANDYRFIVGKSISSYLTSVRVSLNTYFEFLKHYHALESQYPYIEIYQKEKVFNELIPITYIFVADRPYIVFHQSNMGTIIEEKRFRPKFKILDTFNKDPQNSVAKYGESTKYEHKHTSIKDLMDELFSLPTTYIEDKNIITSAFNQIFKFDYDKLKLYYDWRKECYFFDREVENMMFQDLSIRITRDNIFYKYCSLDTLIAILNSGNIRLNSISAMNDPTESTKLISDGCNFQQNTDDILKETNNFFITSFTSLEDNLNMWRFYGDNAQGVCLKFEKKNNIEPDIFEINYCDLKCDTLEKINRFLDSLNEKNIRFCIQSYTETMLFVKPNDYRDEREKRLLIGDPTPAGYTVYSNKIVSPFIEKTLSTHKKSEENCDFPLKLTKIILGPELKNKELNKLQLKYLIENSPQWNGSVDVDVSKLVCYRT